MLLTLSDNMGNLCVEGGAPLKAWVDIDNVTASVEDKGDGTYMITWNGQVAGTHRMHVTIDGAHVIGSPAMITLEAAAPDIPHCELVGEGIKSGTAGVPTSLLINFRDQFGNAATPSTKYTYGLVLLPLPSNDKGGRAGKAASKAGGGKSGGQKDKVKDAAEADMRAAEEEVESSYNMPAINKPHAKTSAAERATLAKTLPSIEFEGQPEERSSHRITYVPHDAGDFELHAWCDYDGSGSRIFFPGCPFQMVVKSGRPSASGSYLRDGGISAFTAGEKLILRVQLRDEFGNPSSLLKEEEGPEGKLQASLETPGGLTMPLTTKVGGSEKTGGGGEGGGGGGAKEGGGGRPRPLQRIRQSSARMRCSLQASSTIRALTSRRLSSAACRFMARPCDSPSCLAYRLRPNRGSS